MQGGEGGKLPLVILAGGERRDEIVPGQKDRISGPKGVRIRLGGRPLIDVVIERFAACGVFDPILIAGPARDYGERRGVATVVDTDGDFATNIRAGLEAAVPHARGIVFFTTCDLVPELTELGRVMDDYFAHEPLDFWYPVVRVPDDRALLGASAEKRQYRVRPHGGRQRQTVLPGHLVMVDTTALRLQLLLDAFEPAYRTRTRGVARRFVCIVAGAARRLLAEDLRSLRRGRAPLLTLEVFLSALPLAVSLGLGLSSATRNEARVRRLFAHRDHRRDHPERHGRIPVVDALSLALDIDTQKEADEHHLQVTRGPKGSGGAAPEGGGAPPE